MLFSTFPAEKIVNTVRAAGIPCALSEDAGSYVCNDVYYALLACEETYGHRGIFVHVPGTEAVATPQAARAITLCTEAALNV